MRLIDKLKMKGQVIISAEREIHPDLEPFRMRINLLDIHHLMAFARGYIGDSQTMAAEAGVLGIPYIRYNDFVGQIGYLNDLELNFRIGTGILTKDIEKLHDAIDVLLEDDASEIAKKRRGKMLDSKKDLNKIITDLIETYPKLSDYTI